MKSSTPHISMTSSSHRAANIAKLPAPICVAMTPSTISSPSAPPRYTAPATMNAQPGPARQTLQEPQVDDAQDYRDRQAQHDPRVEEHARGMQPCGKRAHRRLVQHRGLVDRGKQEHDREQQPVSRERVAGAAPRPANRAQEQRAEQEHGRREPRRDVRFRFEIELPPDFAEVEAGEDVRVARRELDERRGHVRDGGDRDDARQGYQESFAGGRQERHGHAGTVYKVHGSRVQGTRRRQGDCSVSTR